MRFGVPTLLAATLLAAAASAQTGGPLKSPVGGLGKPPAPSSSFVTLPAPSGAFLGGMDDCAAPSPIAGQGQFPFDNSTATTGTEGQNEALCYSFGVTVVENDVWFCWTADDSGCAIVTTCGLTAGVDTKIAAYPGCGCPVDGTALACDDDTCSSSNESTMYWQVTSGSTYTIQVGTFPGQSGGTGMLDVSIFPDSCPDASVNDDCSTPLPIAGQGLWLFDNSTATTGSEGQNEPICYYFATSAIASDVWYCWTAPCSGDATVSLCGLTDNDSKVAIYPGCGCPQDGTSIGCNDDNCIPLSVQSEVTWAVVSGSTYTIQLGSFPGGGAGLGMFSVTVTPCLLPITPLCFGDGSGTLCPCGNLGGSGEGCANGSGTGSTLDFSGTNSIAAADLVLESSNAVPSQPGLFFQGDNSIAGGNGIPFGDGLRCCGMNVVRLEVVVPDGNGDAATSIDVAGTGGVAAGDTRCYQYWYRDPLGSPCAFLFNLTNALEILWEP